MNEGHFRMSPPVAILLAGLPAAAAAAASAALRRAPALTGSTGVSPALMP